MDLNDLFSRQQLALMHADAATCPPTRQSQLDLAADFGRRAEALRSQLLGGGAVVREV